MSSPQYYIDALRKGDFSEALKLIDDVNLKYAKISGRPDLGQEDFLQLLIYELCKTDLTIDDADILNFFSEYVFYNNIHTGGVGYRVMTIAQAFPLAIELKRNASNHQVIDNIKIDDKDSFEKFIDEESAFSQLTTEVDESSLQLLIKLIAEPQTEQVLAAKINNMDTPSFNRLQENVNIMKIQYELDFDCPLIQGRLDQQNQTMARSHRFKTNLKSIRDRSFITNKMPKAGTPDQILDDLYKNRSVISINGVLLRDIFIEKFKIITTDKTQESVDQEIGRFLANDDKSCKTSYERIIGLYKELFFSKIQDEQIKTQLAKDLSSITHQEGILSVLGNTLAKNAAQNGQGYSPQTKTTISILTYDNGFTVEEECQVMNLKNTNSNSLEENQSYTRHENLDGSPLMILNNSFQFRIDENCLEYAHTDLEIQYNDKLCEAIFDRRSLFDKIIEIVKSIFRVTEIEEVPIDKPSISP
ncbi:MAG: hypothetical protein H0U70_03025 [Tatlockia sp.]|nr:hypothetical protein [Tatlockia sp.]